ncbi:MAG: helix-turn-helix transcriptional regulator [Cryomorphaceae bacterium]
MAELSNKEINKIKIDVPILIGNNIRNLRMEKGLSQTELADRILSDRQYLYKIETAKVGVTITKLTMIARALDVPVSRLVYGV